MPKYLQCPALTIALLAFPLLALAEEEGQADLDKATELKVDADSLADLERVAALCESALKKGLSDDSEIFAKQLLTSSLYEHAEQLSGAIFDRESPDPRWPVIRQLALKSLEKVLEYDEEFLDAHVLIARLCALPGGDMERGGKAADEAVKLAGDDNEKLSQALVLRGTLTQDDDQRLADFNQAVKIDPTSAEAVRTRGLLHLSNENYEKSAEDFETALKLEPDHLRTRQALIEALTHLEKYDEAIKQADEAIKQAPDQPLGYTLRARVHALQEDVKGALADLDKAIEADPRDITALLLRARLRQAEDMTKEAREDVDRALNVRPGLVQGLLLRAMLSAAEDRWDEAIADMRLLVENDPENEIYALQLAVYYIASGRPRKGIETLDEIIAENPTLVEALRARGDALLSIGKQQEAIVDYETILKLDPENEGALNNLAWTLSTSPIDDLRDGKRAVQLATKASEVTEYKAAYILSTLASAHAETGDFKTAVKWSRKAQELADEDIKGQLEKELESYRQERPWRELQETAEKPDVARPSGGDFEL